MSGIRKATYRYPCMWLVSGVEPGQPGVEPGHQVAGLLCAERIGQLLAADGDPHCPVGRPRAPRRVQLEVEELLAEAVNRP